MKDVMVEDTILGEDESSFVDDLGLGEDKGDSKDVEKKENIGEEETTEEEEESAEEEEEVGKEEDTEEEEESKEVEEEKDLTKEELAKLPKDAKGLYYALKKQRERTKEAEAKLAYIEIQNKYGKKPDVSEPAKKEDEEKFETVEDILKDKDDDDLLTAGEQRRIETAKENQRRAEERKSKLKIDSAEKEKQEGIRKIDELEKAFKSTHSDYDEMFGVFTQAIKEIPSLQLEILSEMKRENGNPAQKAYELGKKFKGIYGAEKKPSDGKAKDVKRILKNAEKKTPSASISGSSVSNEELEEMEIDELGKTLTAMSMSEFMRVPRKIRQKAMR
uniref:Uncharacterized protein n=1 Tax=viral metagenome TaxID=1070528 RepID=A0A6H1ZCB4_9ZZZZ